MARTASPGTMPEFMLSATLCEFLTVELAEHAATVEREARENGSSRLDAARVRLLNGAVAQLNAYHYHAATDGA